MAYRHRAGRQVAALLLGLLAGCGSAPVADQPEVAAATPSMPTTEEPAAATPARASPPPVAARSRPKAEVAQTAPGLQVVDGDALPSGQTSVTAEPLADRDKVTVTAPPLNGVWRLEMPIEMSSDESHPVSHDMTALYCRLYHYGASLALRCAAAAPLSDPAEARIDGERIRFAWRFDGGTLTVDAAIRSPQDLDGQVVVQPEKENAAPLRGPAKLVRLDPPPPGDGPNEALVRDVVEDLRRDKLDEKRYAPGRLDTLADHRALRVKELAELGALETVTPLGEMPTLNRDLDTGKPIAGFAAEKLAVRVYDLHFTEDSRLCSVLTNDAGQVYSFNCY
jgi:hypothetical protein